MDQSGGMTSKQSSNASESLAHLCAMARQTIATVAHPHCSFKELYQLSCEALLEVLIHRIV